MIAKLLDYYLIRDCFSFLLIFEVVSCFLCSSICFNHKYECFPSNIEKASHYRRQRSRSHSSSTFGTGLGDDKSEISEIYPSFSCCSEATRPSDEGGIKHEPLSKKIHLFFKMCHTYVFNTFFTFV